MVNHRGQAFGADLIAVAGHSLSCTTHLLRIDVLALIRAKNSGTRKAHVLETLLCPRPGPLKAAGSHAGRTPNAPADHVPRQLNVNVDRICIATECAKNAFQSDLWRNRCVNQQTY